MSPFLTIIALNAFVHGLAYFVLHPRLSGRDTGRMMWLDLALVTVTLAIGWFLFHGEGHRFSLILFDTNWVVFTIVTGFAIEIPLLLHYMARQGMTWQDFGGED